jgi:hypothetical protein
LEDAPQHRRQNQRAWPVRHHPEGDLALVGTTLLHRVVPVHRCPYGEVEAVGVAAQLFTDVDAHAEPERARQVGAFYCAILSGLMTQWLVDPNNAPSGSDLAAALDEVLSAGPR